MLAILAELRLLTSHSHGGRYASRLTVDQRDRSGHTLLKEPKLKLRLAMILFCIDEQQLIPGVVQHKAPWFLSRSGRRPDLPDFIISKVDPFQNCNNAIPVMLPGLQNQVII